MAGAMAAAAADSGSEDLYTDSDRHSRTRSSTVMLALSERAQTTRLSMRNSQDFGPPDSRNSRESQGSPGSSAGLLRLSLPNGGWGRRSLESFDDEEGDYSYGHKSGSGRGYDEDSAPMMASLTLPKGKLDSSLTSAVDMRASQSLLLSPDLRESSLLGDRKQSKYREFVDSIDASNTAKRIPFGDDDDEVIEEVETGGAKSLSERNRVAEEKGLPGGARSERKGSKSDLNSPVHGKVAQDYSEVQGFQHYDSDEDEGSATFDLSQGNLGSLSGFQATGPNASKALNGPGPSGSNARVKESVDLGRTVSTLGGSGSVVMPAGLGVGSGGAGGKGHRAEEKGLGRFDFDRTVDSEGDMLRGRDVPMSQVGIIFRYALASELIK